MTAPAGPSNGGVTDAEIIASVCDDLPVGVWVARAPGGEFVYANKCFAQIMGMGARSDVARGEYAEPYGICTRTGEPYPEERMPFVRALEARTTVTVDDIVIHRPDGRHVSIRAEARPVFDHAGAIAYVVIAFIDITREAVAETARAETEARLHHAQRMESIGVLAGGIAHDFNNLLAAMKMTIAVVLRGADPAKILDYLRDVDHAIDSASQLTRALLGFARRGKHRAEPVSLNEVVKSFTPMVARMIDRRITVSTELAARTGMVIGDASQLEQVLMNLVVNARDALPGGGSIVLRTRDVVMGDEDAGRHGLLAPGLYVSLEVEDDGTGIDPAVRTRIFEPYFTTKPNAEGTGTGLGLATVWGIVHAHGGRIEALPREPHGTRMRVMFPASDRAVREHASEADVAVTAPKARGLVLVVDDERLVRNSLVRALEHLGYEALSAATGEEALALFRPRATEVRAAILDMAMPVLDGRATFLALRALAPALPVVLVTGYALNDDVQGLLDMGVNGFLAKPYTLEALAQALARAGVA